jgi:hypothetical protein
VLGLYNLGVVSVQRADVGGDWVVWAVCWGHRRGLSPMMQAWSSLACSNGWGNVGFSLGAHDFFRGHGTLGLRRAGRVCRGVACSMPCRMVCGARGMEACMSGNALHALGVHGACAAWSERGPWRGLRAAWLAGTGWATRAVSWECSSVAAAAGLLLKLGSPTACFRLASA